MFDLFTGPPTDKDHISWSGLCEIKRLLVNDPPFLGDEKYLMFGAELHLRFLKGIKSKFRFSQEEEEAMSKMIKSLQSNRFVNQVMKNSVREVTEIVDLEGVRFKMIGDIIKKKLGADLKTTSARSEEEFRRLAINKYNYLGQGWCYKTGKKLEDFFFIGIQKKKPYSVYILDQKDYAKEERKVVAETRWLLEFYRTHGRARPKSSQDSQSKK